MGWFHGAKVSHIYSAVGERNIIIVQRKRKTPTVSPGPHLSTLPQYPAPVLLMGFFSPAKCHCSPVPTDCRCNLRTHSLDQMLPTR